MEVDFDYFESTQQISAIGSTKTIYHITNYEKREPVETFEKDINDIAHGFSYIDLFDSNITTKYVNQTYSTGLGMPANGEKLVSNTFEGVRVHYSGGVLGLEHFLENIKDKGYGVPDQLLIQYSESPESESIFSDDYLKAKEILDQEKFQIPKIVTDQPYNPNDDVIYKYSTITWE